MKMKIKVTPELTIAKANGKVRAQQEQFHKVLVEVDVAVKARTEAVIELKKEITSLEAILHNKKSAVENALAQNRMDQAFKARIGEIVGN